jgi:hypothetical protein
MGSSGDAVDAPRPFWRSWWVRGATAVALTVWASCWAQRLRFYADNPAPLGRTQGEIDQTLARALPIGTTLDSAKSFFHAKGLGVSIIDSIQEQYRRVGNSFAFPGGELLQTGVANVDFSAFCNVGAAIDLEFDASRRLARRHVDMDNVCM